MALRQPGSTFKLFPYLAALELGLQPSDRVSCGPLEWGGQLFRSSCGGSLSLEQALASSSNTAALRLARRVGLDRVIETARKLGITTPLEAVPGLALGQAEVRLVELTGAYAAVANQGIWHPPSTIRQLTDAEQQRSRTSQAQGQGTGPGRRCGTSNSMGGRCVLTYDPGSASRRTRRRRIEEVGRDHDDESVARSDERT